MGALSPRPRLVLALKGRMRRLRKPGIVKAIRRTARERRRMVRGVKGGRLISFDDGNYLVKLVLILIVE